MTSAPEARTQHPRRRAAAVGGALGAAEARAHDARPRPVEDRGVARHADHGRRRARGSARPRARIYPPLLADQGCTGGAEAQARKAAIPTKVHAEGMGRCIRRTRRRPCTSACWRRSTTCEIRRAAHAVVTLTRSNGDLRVRRGRRRYRVRHGRDVRHRAPRDGGPAGCGLRQPPRPQHARPRDDDRGATSGTGRVPLTHPVHPMTLSGCRC